MSVRRRTALPASFAALSLAAVAACSPSPAPAPSASPSVTATTSACVPFTEPDTVEALGTTVTGLRSVPSFRGGDVILDTPDGVLQGGDVRRSDLTGEIGPANEPMRVDVNLFPRNRAFT